MVDLIDINIDELPEGLIFSEHVSIDHALLNEAPPTAHQNRNSSILENVNNPPTVAVEPSVSTAETLSWKGKLK